VSGCILLSPHAHARVRRVDTSAARAAPGVVGDRVALAVAESLSQARDAAELMAVDYEPLPAVVRIEDAVKPGAPNVWSATELKPLPR
jgi:CO/xanthine dehydrogenase Mo-binding subunit